jgi:hypothetical protein
MTNEIEQLVREVRDMTGVDEPAVLDERSPVLADEATRRATDGEGLYLVGLVGGKDVGKSGLVNALVGRPITEQTSHGPGTQSVIAYAHISQERPLRELLEREARGSYRIVTHDIATLRRQVLLDLPDVDSHFESHLELTRRMLRQMLFPVWISSIEKYADQRVMEMLGRVAGANAPANFIFCLNKVDQIKGDGKRAEDQAEQLREDYANRIRKITGLDRPPRVWLISAAHPERYELPQLKAMLAQQKSERTVEASGQLAERRKAASIVAWLNEQRLPDRAQRLARLQQQADELIAERIGVPVLEKLLPRILSDPARRLEIIDEAQRSRAGRWPVVNLIHALLSPVLLLIRSNIAAPAASVDASTSDHEDLPQQIAATFAQLQQQEPAIGQLYRDWKLWEPLNAAATASMLRRRLADAVDAQRQRIVERFSGRSNPVAALVRLLSPSARSSGSFWHSRCCWRGWSGQGWARSSTCRSC